MTEEAGVVVCLVALDEALALQDHPHTQAHEVLTRGGKNGRIGNEAGTNKLAQN